MTATLAHLPSIGPARALDIGIDLDGVCYDFSGALRRFLRREGRPLASMPPPTCWTFYDRDWGMSDAEFLAACDAATDTGVLFWSGDPYPDTDWALHALKAAGHRLHVVTDRSFGATGVAKQATKYWLERHGLPFDTLTITRDKTVVPVDVIIDDRCENYDALNAAGHRPYLFTRPWNAHHPGRRVGSWREFLTVVDMLARRWS